MQLKELIKNLNTVGIKTKDIAEKTGINVYTLYAISSGKSIGKQKEEYLLSVIPALYSKEIELIALWDRHGARPISPALDMGEQI